MTRDVIQASLNNIPQVPSAVSKPVEARVLVSHGGTEQRLQIMVVLDDGFFIREIGDGGLELGDGVVEEVETVL